VVAVTAGGDVGLNTAGLQFFDVSEAEVAVVQGRGFRLPHLGRDGLHRRDRFPFVVGMMGDRVAHDQAAVFDLLPVAQPLLVTDFSIHLVEREIRLHPTKQAPMPHREQEGLFFSVG